MRNKKGDLSLNIIIVAAIGLLVLVVISVIFMSRSGKFSRSSFDCESQGGVCQASDAAGAKCTTGYKYTSSYKCYTAEGKANEAKPNCCIPTTQFD